MSKHMLKVPISDDMENWFDFIQANYDCDDDNINELVVDFNDVKFLETDDFVVLACLIEKYFGKGAKISFVGGTDGFNAHLDNIKFKKYWSDGFNRDRFTMSLNNTTLCLWKISKEMIYSYSTYAKDYFERFTQNKDLLPLSSNMDEVFNNIFDHSQSEITGYIITQYFPRNNYISFSVCDFGIGIPQSIKNIRDKEFKNTDDWVLIMRSLEKGFSIQSTHRNRGFGLNNILDLVENSKGELTIISNKGIVFKKAGESYRGGDQNYDFRGTLIKVKVDLSTFEEKNSEEEFFDF